MLYIYSPPGNPTKFNPTPNPAPERVDAPIEGMYVSKMLNVAAAVNASNKISSMFNERLGMAYAAMATIRPSTKYLMIRFINSATLNIIIINK